MADAPFPISCTGFAGFRLAATTMATKLGGTEAVWRAVAKEFDEALVKAMSTRLGVSDYDIPANVHYMRAEEADFDAAKREALQWFAREGAAPQHAAPWGGARITLRDRGAYLEGGGFGMAVVLMGSPRPKHDRSGREAGMDWPVFLTDFGRRCLGRALFDKPTSSTAKSEDGARRSMQRMAEQFFGVSLEELAHAE